MEYVIEATGLDVRYQGCHALRSVDFRVKPGTIYALLGENGAGKTTLIKVLTGFLKPHSGTCRVLGLDPQKDPDELRRRISYVADSPALYDWMHVEEIGWFAASFYAEGFRQRYLELVDHYAIPKNRKIKSLSKGQRAKVALSLALAPDPDVLILDEPTSGLDPIVRREFLESMLERISSGKTVLLSSHQISEVERVADEVAILHAGEVKMDGNLQELRESTRNITVTLSDALVTIPLPSAPAQILRQRQAGRQLQLLVRHFSDRYKFELEQLSGVMQVTERNTSLEELFSLCVLPPDETILHSPADTSPNTSSEVA
ncbi:MAG: ABC transporter ATP-binding protein [Planctomycetales bacterium]|nr:ABC transporter ATP-binding protein [Planctomycetales bacterium]